MSADLDSYRGAVIDDINIDGCRLLVVGINPGLWTARAGELGADEIRDGGRILEDKVARQRRRRGGPEIVMVAGIGAFRTAFGSTGPDGRKVVVGKQQREIGGAETWVVPNPSGLNAHETVDSLARAYREVWERLG